MLPGRPEPELPTDQQCDHCGRFFRVSGVESHQENCEVGESESVVSHGSGLVTSQCEHCGVWARTTGTTHREDCQLNENAPEMLGDAVTILAPFELPEISAEDF